MFGLEWDFIIEIAGAQQASNRVEDSVSLLPYLTNPGQGALKPVVFSERFDTGPPNASGFATVRDDRYKLIRWYPAGTEEFYDLMNDPFENIELLAVGLTPQQQRIKNEFAVLIHEVR